MALEWKFVADLRGVRGLQGVKGETGLPGTGSVPADEFIAAAIRTESETQAAGDERYASAPAFNIVRPAARIGSAANGALMTNLKDWAFANGTDDTNAIQDCLDTLSSLGLGQVYVPRGDYTHTSNRLTKWTNIVGEGYRTRFNRKANSPEGPQFSLKDPGGEMVSLRMLQINGNKAFNTTLSDGFSFDNAGGSGFSFYDPCLIVEDVWILNTTGRGGHVAAGGRDSKFSRIRVHGSEGIGLDLESADSTMESLTVGAANSTGIRLAGTNSRYIGLKSFGSRDNGFYIGGSRNSVIGCEAQDNGGDGFAIGGVAGVQMSGLISDSNGKTTGGYAYHFVGGARYTDLTGAAMDRFSSPTQGGAVRFDGTNTFINVDLMAYDNLTPTKLGTLTSGNIRINGASAPL